MKIGSVNILERVLIVAEIGTNHNGRLETAETLIEEAVKAGVDAVKFQTFTAERFISKSVPVFLRAKSLGYKNQFDRIKDLEFSAEQLHELYEFAINKGLIFMSTPFDEDAVDILEPLVPAYKVASGDLINTQLLRYIASKGKPVILSTGQANIEEINSAIRIFENNKVALMHCVSSYPTPDEQANLRSISFLRSQYNLPVGYSDHTIGILACIAAVALGARIIEKHFTFDKTQNFGDHSLSADPAEMKYLVGEIRRLEKMLGVEEKVCQPCEEPSKKQLRRTLHLNLDAPKETILRDDMLIPLVSATGIRADRIDEVTGKRLIRNMKRNEAITEEDIC